MTKPDPIIPKLLDIKQRDQEIRLADITNEIRIHQQKLQELMDEASRLNQRADGYDRMSVANGYLRYLDHRQSSIKERLSALQRSMACTTFARGSSIVRTSPTAGSDREGKRVL